MSAAVLPRNENARLQALRALDALETADEPVFGAITRLAAELLEVPTAFISLIDENRQWLRACVGVTGGSSPREESFCAHTILEPEHPTVVPDTRQDPRFADSPFVTRDGIHFYVGIPLVTPEGYALGSLCGVDSPAREAPTPDILARLQDLAALAVELLRVRLVTRRLQAIEAGRGRGRDLIDVVYHAADMGFLMLDRDLRIVDLNPRTAELCTRGDDSLIGLPVAELVAPHQREEAEEAIRQVLRDGEPFRALWLLEQADGAAVPTHVVTEPIDLDDGGRFLLATLTDVTREQRRSRLTEDRAHILEMVIRHAPIAEILDQVGITLRHQHPEALVLVTRRQDGHLELEYASEDEQALTREIHRLPLDPNTQSCRGARRIGEVLVCADLREGGCEERYREAARELSVRSTWSFAIPGQDGQSLGTLSVCHRQPVEAEPADLEALREVAGLAALAMERRQLMDELRRRADTDALTGLPNRSLLQERVDKALAGLGEDDSLALLLIDLDNFKLVNDALGHEAGDRLLREVAASLASSVRPGDTVARLGGDEFVVLLPDGGKEAARRVAEKLRETVSRTVTLREEWLRVSPSIGVALAPEHARSFSDLLRAADAAMYTVKGRGRNGVAFHDEEIRHAVEEAFRLSRDLQGDDLAAQLSVEAEARVNSAGTLLAAELRVCWTHPELGPRSTTELLHQAGRSGALEAVESLGLAALEECGHALRAASGDVRPVYRLAQGRFWDERFLQRLQTSLAGLPVPPEVALPLTGHADEQQERVQAALTGLREAVPGVAFCLVGFGGAQASVALLDALGLDAIALDPGLVAELDAADSGRAARARRRLEPVLRLARELAPQVVATGVEREGQWAALQQLGCDAAQGPLFAPHLPATLAGLQEPAPPLR